MNLKQSGDFSWWWQPWKRGGVAINRAVIVMYRSDKCLFTQCLLCLPPPHTQNENQYNAHLILIRLVCLFVCLMVFNATFNNISVISFYWWRKPEDPEKTTDLSQVTDKLYHIMLTTSPWSRFELTTSVMIGTDCIGSCKSNYHTITATTAP